MSNQSSVNIKQICIIHNTTKLLKVIKIMINGLLKISINYILNKKILLANKFYQFKTKNFYVKIKNYLIFFYSKTNKPTNKQCYSNSFFFYLEKYFSIVYFNIIYILIILFCLKIFFFFAFSIFFNVVFNRSLIIVLNFSTLLLIVS